MKIYPAEENLTGLDKTTLLARVVSVQDGKQKMPVEASQEDKDVSVMRSILVSTGFNLNNDVFLPEELFNARNTPVDKPINVEHNDKDIIGHMVASELVDRDGKTIAPKHLKDKKDKKNKSTVDLPNQFDIEVQGILYRNIFPELIAQIIQDVENEKAFVSMEALFTDFDFAVERSEAEIVIIPRNEETAFLTSHLRQFGGSGTLPGKDLRLGRVLKNIVFIGKGIVSNPANPRSIIKDAATFIHDSTMVAEILEKGGEDRAMEKELEAVRKERDSLKADYERVNGLLKELTKQSELLLVTNEELKTSKDLEIKTLTDEAVTLKAQFDSTIEELTAKVDEFTAKEIEVEAVQTSKDRLEKLTKISQIAEDKVDETLAKLRPEVMTEAQFDLFVEMASNLVPAQEEETPDEELDKVKANVDDSAINPGQEDTSDEDPVEKTAMAIANYMLPNGGEG